jgi:rhodanese-related sulfurtransferase
MKRPAVIRYLVLLALLGAVLMGLTPAIAGTLQTVSPRQFKALLDRHRGDSDVVLLDVRTPREFADGHIAGAVLVDYYAADYVDRLKRLDRDKTYFIYCRSGRRSGKTLEILQKLGFQHVYDLATGIIGWSHEHYPLVRRSSS